MSGKVELLELPSSEKGWLWVEQIVKDDQKFIRGHSEWETHISSHENRAEVLGMCVTSAFSPGKKCHISISVVPKGKEDRYTDRYICAYFLHSGLFKVIKKTVILPSSPSQVPCFCSTSHVITHILQPLFGHYITSNTLSPASVCWLPAVGSLQDVA